METPTWRNTFNSYNLLGGTYITTARNLAKTSRYTYFAFNNTVYVITDTGEGFEKTDYRVNTDDEIVKIPAESRDWTNTFVTLPKEDKPLWAMDSSGHVQELVYSKGMFWFPDKSMYVYFTPKFWRYKD